MLFRSGLGKGWLVGMKPAARAAALSESSFLVKARRQRRSACKACDIRVALAPTLEWVCCPTHSAHGLSRGGHRNGERVRQGGQGMQSRAQALDGQGALLTTRRAGSGPGPARARQVSGTGNW